MATSDEKDKKTQSHNNDQKMSASEAGKLGGEKVLKERGPEFYSEIGSHQGKENNPGNFANRSKEDVQAAGRHGGEARNRDNSKDDQDDRKAA
ncbi:MAG TPA: KGG domain-containing protein [Candidatus Saccharimonadia bacterium]